MVRFSVFGVLAAVELVNGFHFTPPRYPLNRARAPSFLSPSSRGCLGQQQQPTRALRALDEKHLVEHLEKDMLADLAVLAKKFSNMVHELKDISDLHVTHVDGQSMSLAVVYCDGREGGSCVALDVPITFPRYCDTEEQVDEVLHELEELDEETLMGMGLIKSGNLPPKPKLSEEFLGTLVNVSEILNESFTEDLEKMARAFGGPHQVPSDAQIESCRLDGLNPEGFTLVVRLSELQPPVEVPIRFSRDCSSAHDLQEQILGLSAAASMDR